MGLGGRDTSPSSPRARQRLEFLNWGTGRKKARADIGNSTGWKPKKKKIGTPALDPHTRLHLSGKSVIRKKGQKKKEKKTGSQSQKGRKNVMPQHIMENQAHKKQWGGRASPGGKIKFPSTKWKEKITRTSHYAQQKKRGQK